MPTADRNGQPGATERVRRVLIIDDNQELVKSYGRILAAQGYQVSTANDGIQGTTLAFREKPDLILIDLHMPGGDGHTVGTRIRDNFDTCNLPIVVLTGSAHAEDVKRANEWGATRVLFKPIRPEELKSIAAEFIPATPEK